MSDTNEAGAKDRIRRTALDLFAERGVDGVSSREILRRAGQRNSNALQYHFGDRAGLLAAVIEPFQARVDDRRDALLDAVEAGGRITTRALAEALVRPAASMLTVEGGKQYLRIMAELNDDPDRSREIWSEASHGLDRWVRLAEAAMSSEVAPLHRRYAAVQLAFSELRRRVIMERRADHRLFESDLIDLVTAVLDAVPSAETRRLLAEREDVRREPPSAPGGY